MATTTPNLGMTLPAVSDAADIGVLNGNFQKIDEYLYSPPMIPGVEYRTTERWNGKLVYTKLVDCGGLINGKNVEWRHDSAIKPIRAVVTVEGRGAMPFDFGNNNAYNCHATVDGSIYLYSDGGYDGYQVYAAVWYTKD